MLVKKKGPCNKDRSWNFQRCPVPKEKRKATTNCSMGAGALLIPQIPVRPSTCKCPRPWCMSAVHVTLCHLSYVNYINVNYINNSVYSLSGYGRGTKIRVRRAIVGGNNSVLTMLRLTPYSPDETLLIIDTLNGGHAKWRSRCSFMYSNPYVEWPH